MISIEALIFYAFSLVLLLSAGGVVLSQNPVRAALFLVLAFFASSGLWILLEAEFLALILILVYVGAVMTLFLFVVMTLNMQSSKDDRSLWRYLPLGVLIAALFTAFVVMMLAPAHFNAASYAASVPLAAKSSNTQALGDILYTQYAYPFEVAGLLLLVAIIAAVSLTARVDRNRKWQVPKDQIAVRPEDRIRMVK